MGYRERRPRHFGGRGDVEGVLFVPHYNMLSLVVLAQLAAAHTIAVIGGGATGVSVADNLAREGRGEVHLFHSGAEPLPGYHPRARAWIVERLTAAPHVRNVKTSLTLRNSKDAAMVPMELRED